MSVENNYKVCLTEDFVFVGSGDKVITVLKKQDIEKYSKIAYLISTNRLDKVFSSEDNCANKKIDTVIEDEDKKLIVSSNPRLSEIFEYVDGKYFYNGIAVSEYVLCIFKDIQKNGGNYKPVFNFLCNVSENPSKISVEEFFIFFEKWKPSITEDGCILAYKKVNHDFSSVNIDRFGNKVFNKIGTFVEMDRSEVDANRESLCSSGLHCCSFGYLSFFSGGSKTIIVKLNPKDVVSIPNDHKDQKIRCCRYFVLCEYDKESDYLSSNGVVGPDFIEDIANKDYNEKLTESLQRLAKARKL